MAHETAHITQHHIARMLADQSQQSLTTAAAMIGAILLGALAGGGQATEGGIAATQGLAVQHQINFTRDNECGGRSRRHRLPGRRGLRSPRHGRHVRDHDAPRGARCHLHSRDAASITPWTRTASPSSAARAAQFPPRKGKDSQSYELIRERVRVLTAAGDVGPRRAVCPEDCARRRQARQPLR